MVQKNEAAEELYDTQNDPYELTKDKGFIPEKIWIESMWPGMIQPTTAVPAFKVTKGKVDISWVTPGSSLSYQITNKGNKADEKVWQLYVTPLQLKPGQILYAMAERIGYKPSKIVQFSSDKN